MRGDPRKSVEWLSTEVVAARLGITTRILSQLIDNGIISVHRVGSVACVQAVDVDRYLDACRIEPGTITHLYSAVASDESVGRCSSESVSESSDRQFAASHAIQVSSDPVAMASDEPADTDDRDYESMQCTDVSVPPEPWGSPPTPLLPRWYLDALGETPLPSYLVDLLVEGVDGVRPRTVSDLVSFWKMRSQPLNAQARSMLFKFVLKSDHPRPPMRHVVVPAEVDLTRLLLCPLGTRAQNCIDKAFDIGIIAPGRAMTVAELLSLPKFGVASLLNVMCVAEVAVDSGFLNALLPETDEGGFSSSPKAELGSTRLTSSPQRDAVVQGGYEERRGAEQGGAVVQDENGALEDLSPAWHTAMVPLGKLISAAAEIHDARTLADVLVCDLGSLMFNLGVLDNCDSVMASDLAPSPTPAEEALAVLVEFCESLSPLHRLILRKRVLATKPLSQAKIGSEVGLTGEAIRRQQKRLDSLLWELFDINNAFGCWTSAFIAAITEHIGPIVHESHLEMHISAAFPETADVGVADVGVADVGVADVGVADVGVADAGVADAGVADAGVADAGEAVAEEPFDGYTMVSIARQLLRRELSYTCDGGICINREAVIVTKTLKDMAMRLADDVGMVAEAELFESMPEVWRPHADALVAWCGLHHIGNGRIALRDTARARVKAAMLAIGRPATKEEIAEACGFTPDRIRHQLFAIADVVRADKTRWGFREWIDDVYEGIPAEILQRIEQDGGATRLDGLVEELPRKFGVSESSVRAYVATSKFSLAGGYVRVADPSRIAFKPLSVVVHGHTDDGKPFWEFDVKARYFDGYSLAGLPPEVAMALGCEPDGKMRIPISHPTGCRPISVSWQLSSTSGAVVGFLSDPLRRLGARSGDHAALVIDSPESVSVRLSDSSEHPTEVPL